jgi:hypothetical protein
LLLVVPQDDLLLQQPDFSLTAPGLTVSVLVVHEDWLLQQPLLLSLTAPGATWPVAGQVLVHSLFSPTAPGETFAPSLQHADPSLQQAALPSLTAPGEVEAVLVELQPTMATTVQTATKLRIDFIEHFSRMSGRAGTGDKKMTGTHKRQRRQRPILD